MTSDASEPGAPRPAAISYWLWVSAAGIVLAVVVVLGVRGCGSEDPQAAAERAEEQKKKEEEERGDIADLSSSLVGPCFSV